MSRRRVHSHRLSSRVVFVSIMTALFWLAAGAVRAQDAPTLTALTHPCPLSLCPWHDFETAPRWSPDGTLIAFTSAGVDLQYHLTGGQVGVLLAPGGVGPVPDFATAQIPHHQAHQMTSWDPTWSRDGQQIACWMHDGLSLLTAGGDTVRTLVGAGYGGGRMDWAPHADLLAVSFAGSLATVDVSTGDRTWVPPVVGIQQPAWSADGQWIAYTNQASKRDIWIIPASGGVPRRITQHAGDDASPTWSPDGERLAFTSDRSGNHDIWIIDVNGGGPVQVTTDPAEDTSPDWSPDGEHIVFESDRGDPGFPHIWMVSDLQTLAVESTDWSDMKKRFR